jgi:hypothetical protein
MTEAFTTILRTASPLRHTGDMTFAIPAPVPSSGDGPAPTEPDRLPPGSG